MSKDIRAPSESTISEVADFCRRHKRVIARYISTIKDKKEEWSARRIAMAFISLRKGDKAELDLLLAAIKGEKRNKDS